MLNVKQNGLLSRAGLFVLGLFLTGCISHSAPKGLRVSFLNDPASLADTIKILRRNGCSKSSVEGFKKAVEYYYQVPLAVDLTAFPPPKKGVYLFRSGEAFASALPESLFATQHPFEINCLDVALHLSGDHVSTTLIANAPSNRFFVEVNCGGDNRPQAYPVISPQNAFEIRYPPWYTNMVTTITGRPFSDEHISLMSCFAEFHMNFQDSPSEKTGSSLLQVLRSRWDQQGVVFSEKVQTTLLHRIDVANKRFFTSHAGLLFQNGRGYTYIEKSGGQGPFLRIDLQSQKDLAPYFGTLISGRWNEQFSRNFMTVNDRLIAEVFPRSSE